MTTRDEEAGAEYEQRQADRKQRYLDRADRADEEATARFNSHNTRQVRDLQGQPVLIGHHSEKRHRALLKRSDNDMRKGSEAYEKAKHYRGKAAGVGRGGISADDPNALDKIWQQLARKQLNRDAMKEANAAWRKAGKPRGLEPTEEDEAKWARLEEQAGADLVQRLRRMMSNDFMHRPPFTYALTNIGSEIRRLQKRIDSLEAEAEAPEREPINGAGWVIFEHRDENRVCVEFSSKPEEDIRRHLKSAGFRWNRRLVAWTRQLNNAGWYAGEEVARFLRGSS